MIGLAFIVFCVSIVTVILWFHTNKTTQPVAPGESSAKKNIHLIMYHKSKVNGRQ